MAKKTRKKMSAAARRRISQAQKQRWAAYRSEGGNRKGKKKGRRGRPRKVRASGNNPFMNMTIEQLVASKQKMEEAWQAARTLLR
jgi:hypothetical protein